MKRISFPIQTKKELIVDWLIKEELRKAKESGKVCKNSTHPHFKATVKSCELVK